MKLKRAQLEPGHRPKTVDTVTAQSADSSRIRFNAAVDFTTADRRAVVDNLKAELDKAVQEGHQGWDIYLLQLSDLMTLDPVLRAEFQIDDFIFRSIRAEVEHHRVNHNVHDFLDQQAMLCRIFPNKRSELGLDEDCYRMCVGCWRSNFSKQSVCSIDNAANMKILFPDRVDEMGLDRAKFEIMKASMEERKRGVFAVYIETLANMVMLFPEYKNELDVTSELLQQIRTEMQKCREVGAWYYVVAYAKCLKILTADEVQVTNQGIVTKFNSQMDGNASLPERQMV